MYFIFHLKGGERERGGEGGGERERERYKGERGEGSREALRLMH